MISKQKIDYRLGKGYLLCDAILNRHTCTSCGAQFQRDHKRSKCDRCDCIKYPKESTCIVCSSSFTQLHPNNLYCSASCRGAQKRERRDQYYSDYQHKLKINRYKKTKPICITRMPHFKTRIKYVLEKGVLTITPGDQTQVEYRRIINYYLSVVKVGSPFNCIECGSFVCRIRADDSPFCSTACIRKYHSRIASFLGIGWLARPGIETGCPFLKSCSGWV